MEAVHIPYHSRKCRSHLYDTLICNNFSDKFTIRYGNINILTVKMKLVRAHIMRLNILAPSTAQTTDNKRKPDCITHYARRFYRTAMLFGLLTLQRQRKSTNKLLQFSAIKILAV